MSGLLRVSGGFFGRDRIFKLEDLQRVTPDERKDFYPTGSVSVGCVDTESQVYKTKDGEFLQGRVISSDIASSD